MLEFAIDGPVSAAPNDAADDLTDEEVEKIGRDPFLIAYRDRPQLQRQAQHYFKTPGMNTAILYRIDSAKRMHLYYRMDVQPDLFGQWCLMCEWGRIGSTGQTRSPSLPRKKHRPRLTGNA